MTQGKQPVERRLDTFETAWRRSKRTNLAWFLGGTLLLVIFIVVLSDIGSGLIETRERLESLEKQMEQVPSEG